MEVEETSAGGGGGEKGVGVEVGALCFGPMDGVHEEMLDPIWSELDGFGSGVLNGLLSSDDIHGDGAVPEMDARGHGHAAGGAAGGQFKMLGVKEEFPQLVVAPESSSRAEMDAQSASLVGSVNIHDYFAIKDMPQNSAESSPYGLALPGSHENLGFHGSSFQGKDELLGDDEPNNDSSAGLENNSNGTADDCGLQMQEQFLFQANMVEDDVAELIGVGSASNSSLERAVNVNELLSTVNVNELHSTELPGKENEDDDVTVGTGQGMLGVVRPEKIAAKKERGPGSAVIALAEANPVEQRVDGVRPAAYAHSVVDKVNRIKHKDELRKTQLPMKESEEVVSQSVGQEMVGVVKRDEEGGAGAKVNVVVNLENDVHRIEADDAGVISEVVVTVRRREQGDVQEEESEIQGSEVDDEGINSVDGDEISFDGALSIAADDDPLAKISPAFISEMLLDGSISAEGLASKGFVVISDDDEGEGDEEEESDDSSEEELAAVSSIADSDDEEDGTESKSRPKPAQKGKEETRDPDDAAAAPRTKHELDVLPPVPKVTAVLEPHQKTISVGRISSVLDLRVIVESSGTERILNENSIIWMTESRVPLGAVDEVFGPVKNPFYVVRFNELAEIPEDAKTGADVSYVGEFSEFVLKDNPSLYRKAVDASGLDDEELGSDEDLEFSDDEKEAAARMREKSKRALDNREERQGQDWKSASGQHSKGQRTERGRGRGRSGGGGRGATATNAVDSAADFVADMDLQSSPWRPSRPGNSQQQQNGRRWNRGRQNSSRNSGGHQDFTRGSRAGPADGQRSSPQQHQESPQRRDGLYFAEQANRQIFAEQANRQMLAQQANRQMLAESANRQMLAQQANQTGGGMQGLPFNAGSIPAHLQGQGVLRQQQPTAGFQAYGYPQVPGYDARQGSVYSVPGGPQLIQNPVVFGSPNLPPNPFFNNQGQGQMNMIHNPGYGNIVHAGQMNFGVPLNRSLGDTQTGVHPSLLGSGSAVALDHRNPSMPQNSQNQGPQWFGPNKYYK